MRSWTRGSVAHRLSSLRWRESTSCWSESNASARQRPAALILRVAGVELFPFNRVAGRPEDDGGPDDVIQFRGMLRCRVVEARCA